MRIYYVIIVRGLVRIRNLCWQGIWVPRRSLGFVVGGVAEKAGGLSWREEVSPP